MRLIVSMLFLFVCTPNLVMGELITFDDFGSQPALNAGDALATANGGSSIYHGITWSGGFSVAGDQYGVSGGTPFFGIPQSGHYFVTNSTDVVTITTDKVLTGSWWGQNAYYGFSNGADQITISALNGGTVLQALTFDLPGNPPLIFNATTPAFFDTSAFLSLSGITGYQIDRHPSSESNGNWVGDSFTFVAASSPVPEPSSMALLAVGLVTGVGSRLRRRHTKLAA